VQAPLGAALFVELFVRPGPGTSRYSPCRRILGPAHRGGCPPLGAGQMGDRVGPRSREEKPTRFCARTGAAPLVGSGKGVRKQVTWDAGPGQERRVVAWAEGRASRAAFLGNNLMSSVLLCIRDLPLSPHHPSSYDAAWMGRRIDLWRAAIGLQSIGGWPVLRLKLPLSVTSSYAVRGI
jgi:hypothetical protein